MVYLLSFVSLVLIPILVAALLATLLAPVYQAMRRIRVPGVAAALLCVLLLIVVVVGLMGLAGQQIVQGFAQLGDQLGQAVDGAIAWLAGVGASGKKVALRPLCTCHWSHSMTSEKAKITQRMVRRMSFMTADEALTGPTARGRSDG